MKIRYYIIAFIALFMCNTAVFAQERNPNRMVFHKGDKILKTYSVGELDDITFDYVENKEVEISILNVGNNGCKVKFTMPDNCTSYSIASAYTAKQPTAQPNRCLCLVPIHIILMEIPLT